MRYYLFSLRPWSFPMTVISVTTGTFLGALQVGFHLGLYLLVLVGMVTFHAATNLINDYFDYWHGVDKPDSPTVNNRPHVLVEGTLAPKVVLVISLLSYLLVAIIGAYLVILKGLPLLGIGMAGGLISFFYTGDPVKYKYRGWGEFAVFLVWGPLMVSGAYYVQTGTLSIQPVLVSIPLGILVALVLLANNIRDVSYDRRAGIRTVPVVVGQSKALAIFTLFLLISYLMLIPLIWFNFIGLWSLLVLVSAPPAYYVISRFLKRVPKNADSLTATLYLIFGILFLVSFVIENGVNFG